MSRWEDRKRRREGHGRDASHLALAPPVDVGSRPTRIGRSVDRSGFLQYHCTSRRTPQAGVNVGLDTFFSLFYTIPWVYSMFSSCISVTRVAATSPISSKTSNCCTGLRNRVGVGVFATPWCLQTIPQTANERFASPAFPPDTDALPRHPGTLDRR